MVDLCEKCAKPLAAETGGCDCDPIVTTEVCHPRAPAETTTPMLIVKSILDSRLAICALLFLVTGALGLPVLWMSRAFRPATKIWLSLIVIAYTALLLAIAYYCFVMGWREVREFF